MKYIPFSNQPSNHDLHDGQAVNFPPESLLAHSKSCIRAGDGNRMNVFPEGQTNKGQSVIIPLHAVLPALWNHRTLFH